MSEKAFRLDFFLALAALVMSIITTGALVYQTHIMHSGYAAALWPYLSVDTTFGFPDGNGIAVSLINDGFGPALIHSAQLSVDGKPVAGWKEYAKALLADPIIKRMGKRAFRGESGAASSVDGSTIVRAGGGEKMQILRMHSPFIIPQSVFGAHKIALDFCYCSLNGDCWKLHSAWGTVSRPSPVPECTGDAAISAAFD